MVKVAPASTRAKEEVSALAKWDPIHDEVDHLKGGNTGRKRGGKSDVKW